MKQAIDGGNRWIGKEVFLARGIEVGSLVRLEAREGKLVMRNFEEWESQSPGEPVFRVEEGLAPGQLRIRRVRS